MAPIALIMRAPTLLRTARLGAGKLLPKEILRAATLPPVPIEKDSLRATDNQELVAIGKSVNQYSKLSNTSTRDATRTARRAAGVRVSALGAAWLAMPGAGADVTASSPCAHCRCSLTPRRSKVAQARHEFVRLALRHGAAGGAAEPLGAAKRPRRASKRWGARVGAVRPRPLGA